MELSVKLITSQQLEAKLAAQLQQARARSEIAPK